MLRKIRSFEPPCTSPEHNPPTHIVLEPGEYEWVCPMCGKSISFIVPYPPICRVQQSLTTDGNPISGTLTIQ